MNLHGKTILAIDDTAAIRVFLKIALETHGAKLYEASTAVEGIRITREKKPDLVVLDLGLPDRDGLDILPEIKAVGAVAPKVIILSVRKDHISKHQAKLLGADDYLTKPFMMDTLLEAIGQVLVLA